MQPNRYPTTPSLLGRTAKDSNGRPIHQCNHIVQLYDDDQFLCNTVTGFIAEGFTDGQPAVIIATETHRTAFHGALKARGFDVARLQQIGLFLSLDAQETLSAFMVDGMPSAERFNTVVGGTIGSMLHKNARTFLRAYGEMVDLLWRAGNPEAAIALEELWNALAERHSFSLLCAYNMGSFYKEAHTKDFQRVCKTHTHVLPTEQFSTADEADRLRQIAMLQQQSRVLQTEVEHRKGIEQALLDALAQRREAEKVARRSEEELKDFLDNAAEGLHWVGPDGVVIWANKAELHLLGYTHDEYVGHNIAEFHVDQECIKDVLRRLAGNETLHEYEARLRCKDGSIRHVLINSNVFHQDGAFVHTRCFTRDITELKHTQEQLESAVRARDEFLSIASHELRNPVNAISLELTGVLRAAAQGRQAMTPEWISGRVGRANSQVARLARLLDNLLDVSRITAGRVDLEPEETDLAIVIHTAVDRYQEALRGQSVITKLRSATGYWDRLRLDQIVTNLLGNAIKYGEGKPIEIALDVQNDTVCFSVKDNGIGIDVADQERLFGRFERGLPRRNYDGFGLGLWITREIAEAMGGTISVASRPNQGATFSVTLPRRPPADGVVTASG